MNKMGHVVCLALALGGAGCVGVPDDAATAPAPTEEMTAKLVHSIDQGNGHTFEFYDMGDGQIGVKELYEVGDKGVLAQLPGGKYSLSDLFRAVRPGERIPAAILAADLHAEDVLSKPQVIHTAAPGTVEAKAIDSDPGIEKAQSALAAGCSADLFGDNWSAGWFVTNFCNELGYTCPDVGFPRLVHAENLFSDDWWRDGGGAKWLYRHFEGDFNIAGTAKIYRTGFGLAAPVIAWAGSVPPRHVLDFTVGGGWSNQQNHGSGKSPCGHDGSVVVWCGFL
jgi:hypothetical protein